MLRIILGVIAGFIVWTIIWIGSDQVLQTLSPAWFGLQKDAMAVAIANGESFRPDPLVVILDLIRSGIASIMAGFLAAVVANENRRTTLILGIILLMVGVFVQYHLWNVFPIWFHLIFWALLIPLTILGGRLKKTS